MKKLIALMALVAMAACAEAAVTIKLTNESTDRIYCGDTKTLYSGTLYFAFGGKADGNLGKFKNDLTAAYQAGPVDFNKFASEWSSTNDKKLTLKSVEIENGKFPGQTLTFSAINHFTSGMVAFIEVTKDDGTYLGILDTFSLGEGTSDGTITKIWHGTNFQRSSNFYLGAVPEPTSGLLLLLGVAGLALRRKRA